MHLGDRGCSHRCAESGKQRLDGTAQHPDWKHYDAYSGDGAILQAAFDYAWRGDISPSDLKKLRALGL